MNKWSEGVKCGWFLSEQSACILHFIRVFFKGKTFWMEMKKSCHFERRFSAWERIRHSASKRTPSNAWRQTTPTCTPSHGALLVSSTFARSPACTRKHRSSFRAPTKWQTFTKDAANRRTWPSRRRARASTPAVPDRWCSVPMPCVISAGEFINFHSTNQLNDGGGGMSSEFFSNVSCSDSFTIASLHGFSSSSSQSRQKYENCYLPDVLAQCGAEGLTVNQDFLNRIYSSYQCSGYFATCPA